MSHDIVQRQLDRQIRKSFPAARLRIINSTQRLIPPQDKDILPYHSASKCVYQFTHACGVRYIGRTMRLLSKRMSEHNPVSLRSGVPKSISSSIVEHLVDTNRVTFEGSGNNCQNQTSSTLSHFISRVFLTITLSSQ